LVRQAEAAWRALTATPLVGISLADSCTTRASHICAADAADRTKGPAVLRDHNAGGVLWKAGDYDKKLSFDWHPPDRLLGVDSFTNEVYYGALLSLASIERDVAHDPHAAELLEKRARRVKSELVDNFGTLQPVR